MGKTEGFKNYAVREGREIWEEKLLTDSFNP